MDFATAASEPVSETQLVHITYGLVAKTVQYPEDCSFWRNQDYKSWISFQACFIEAQADLRERQQTSRQGVYRANNLVGIKKAFVNLSQAAPEDRVVVTNLTDANKHLANQVANQANHMATKYSAVDTMQKLIQKLQGGIKTLTTRQAGQSTKNTGSSGYKKRIWWTSPCCWTHGAVGHKVIDCKLKAEGRNYKSTASNRMDGNTRGLPESA